MANDLNITPSKLNGALLIEPVVHGDHRGFFMESYNDNVMKQNGLPYEFIQDNQSLSAQPGVLRGLHFQLNPKAQTKLIRVLSGAIYDVIVDIRKGSPTFGQWQGFILSDHNHRQLLVPKGFAHGFCTLVPDTQVLYKVDEFYSPSMIAAYYGVIRHLESIGLRPIRSCPTRIRGTHC